MQVAEPAGLSSCRLRLVADAGTSEKWKPDRAAAEILRCPHRRRAANQKSQTRIAIGNSRNARQHGGTGTGMFTAMIAGICPQSSVAGFHLSIFCRITRARTEHARARAQRGGAGAQHASSAFS